MPASEGTPTIFDKLRVGIEDVFGQVPAAGSVDAETLAGDQRDLQQAVTDLDNIFGPTVKTIETDAMTDVTTLLTGLATAVPTFTSLSQAVEFVKAAVTALGGPLATQILSLGQSALAALVAAALTAAGKTDVPVA